MSQNNASQPKLDMPSTKRSLTIAMNRARENLMAPIREMLATTGLTEQQWRILRVLEEFGPVDATKLADRAGLLLPSQSRIVQTLFEKGFVVRLVNEKDRRRQTIAITQQGYDLVAANVTRSREISAQVEKVLGKERLQYLFGILDELQNF
jgi:homoprotocatechuate degradation regulator HpaR